MNEDRLEGEQDAVNGEPAVAPPDPWTDAATAPWPAVPRDAGEAAPPAMSRRRLGAFVLATALLAASLSAGGTFAIVSLTTRPAAHDPTPAASVAPAGVLTSTTQSEAIVRAAAGIKPSVVTVNVSSRGSGPFGGASSGTGSGFVVSADGLIVTNNHVVAAATTVSVTLYDGREVDASVVKTDAQHDLALIRARTTGLQPARLGSSSSLQVGQLAIAVGSPLGSFTESVTQGIVSGLNREITAGDRGSQFQEHLTGLIQTDAAINAGNSGGPLLDVNGYVIGVVTAAASSAQGVGFAVPIDQAKALISSVAG